MEETRIWEGPSSQVVNLGTYILCLLTCPLIVPVFIALYKYLLIRCRRYEITTQRIKLTEGILSKKRDQIELYRIKDKTELQPFFLRMFSLGNLAMVTSDKTHSEFTIEAVPDTQKLMDELRKSVEICRDKKRVSEVDFE